MEQIATWVNLPTDSVTGTVTTEYILACGFAVVAFALGFMAGKQR